MRLDKAAFRGEENMISSAARFQYPQFRLERTHPTGTSEQCKKREGIIAGTSDALSSVDTWLHTVKRPTPSGRSRALNKLGTL